VRTEGDVGHATNKFVNFSFVSPAKASERALIIPSIWFSFWERMFFFFLALDISFYIASRHSEGNGFTHWVIGYGMDTWDWNRYGTTHICPLREKASIGHEHSSQQHTRHLFGHM
jgi:hypothetical protein